MATTGQECELCGDGSLTRTGHLAVLNPFGFGHSLVDGARSKKGNGLAVNHRLSDSAGRSGFLADGFRQIPVFASKARFGEGSSWGPVNNEFIFASRERSG